MHQGHQPDGVSPPVAVPAYPPRPPFTAPTAPTAEWRYPPPRTRAWHDWWHRHSRTLRALSLVGVLALCGLTILALVREQTGTQGLFVGFGLALLPVPLLVAALRWTDAVEPAPWRNLGFAFAWGACAATLIALLANSFATAWLAGSPLSGSPGDADTLGATVVAPVVEELAKAVAVLLLFLFRRRDFHGVLSGLVVAGITATGFAFTENVLYLGSAFDEDIAFGGSDELHESATATTFFVRVVLSPFAHPLFTALTGVAFGIAAVLPPHRRTVRTLLPGVGLLTAVVLHAVWNAAAAGVSLPFLTVYAAFMLPVLAALIWLAVWSRHNELRTIRRTLPAYAAAGWLSPPEAWGLASMRARSHARALARRTHGPAGARTVLEYQHFATALALLRARAESGSAAASRTGPASPAVPDFHAREQELLHHLWTRRPLAAPPTESAALALARPFIPPQWPGPPSPPYGAHRPYGR